MGKLSNFKGGNLWVIHGNSGSGKTTFTGSFPTPILYLDTDGGLNSLKGFKHIDIDSIDYAKVTSVEQVNSMIGTGTIICSEDEEEYNIDDYKTIVLDHITGYTDICIQHFKNTGSSPGTMNQDKWGKVNDALTMIISYMKFIGENNIQSAIIAQTKLVGVDMDNNTWSEDIPVERVPSLTPSCTTKLMYSCNTAVYLTKQKMKVKKDGKTSKVVRHVAIIGADEDVYTKHQGGKLERQVIANPTYKRIKKELNNNV